MWTPDRASRTVKASRRVRLQVKGEAKSSRDRYKVSIVWDLKFLIFNTEYCVYKLYYFDYIQATTQTFDHIVTERDKIACSIRGCLTQE
jgi:hypothetical protein